MKAIDIMHRQIHHTTILIMEIVKQQINEKNEPASSISNKRKYILE